MKAHAILSSVSLFGLGLTMFACGGSGPSIAPTAIAYIAHPQSHSLSVIDIPADKAVASIEMVSSLTTTPSYPTGVAVTPDGSRAYVTDGSTSVWVVDTRSNSVIAKIAAGTNPEAIAITPDGKSAYVTAIICSVPSCPANPPPLASVEVIDTASNSLTATITIGNLPTVQTPGVLLSGLAISPDGTRAYVTNIYGQIWAIDTASNQVVATIQTAVSDFVGVSISPDGSRLYAASGGNPPVVDVIDTKANAVVTSIALPGFDTPTQIRVTPDGSHAYVSGDNGHLLLIDSTNNVTVATLPISVGNPLDGIAFTPDGTRAYITCGNTNTIFVLDTTTDRILDSIPSEHPGGLAIARPT